MDLTEVLSEIEKMLIRIDNEQDYISNPTNIFIRNNNGRTGDPYFPGLLTLTEDQIVNQMLNQFQNNVSTKITSFRIQFPVGNERIDILLNSSTKSKTSNRKWEWAIEFKKINLIGNNGNNNDYPVQKVFSPFLKDRSMFHDVLKLRRNNANLDSDKLAVIGFSFDFTNPKLITQGLRFQNMNPITLTNTTRSGLTRTMTYDINVIRNYHNNLRRVLRSQDPINLNNPGPRVRRTPHDYRSTELFEQFHQYLIQNNFVNNQRMNIRLFDTFSHPCNGTGVLYGAEIIKP